MSLSHSLYKSHEMIYHKDYLRYPMNSLSSLFYIIPLFNPIITIYGSLLLIGLTVSSTIWWATSTKTSQYFDLLFLSGTQVWILSKSIQNDYLNFAMIPMVFIRDNTIKNLFIVNNSLFLIVSSTNYTSRILFIASLLFKFSDTYGKCPFGTAVFHLLSSLSIYYL